MQRFRDIHKGKRIWLMASGPSLASLDVDRIPSEDIIIACNSAVVKAKKLDYACFTDGAVPAYEYYHDLKNRETKVIIFNEAEIPAIKPETYFIEKRADGGWSFSKDDTMVIFGYDVVHPAMNFAYMLGGRELILCGVDLNSNNGLYHWEDVEGVILPTIQALGKGWVIPDVAYGFGIERNGFISIQKNNPTFKVINISMESTLHCWPKKSFDDVLAESGGGDNPRLL